MLCLTNCSANIVNNFLKQNDETSTSFAIFYYICFIIKNNYSKCKSCICYN